MKTKIIGDQDIERAVSETVQKTMMGRERSGFSFPSISDMFGVKSDVPFLNYKGIFAKSEDPQLTAHTQAVEKARQSNVFASKMTGYMAQALPFLGPIWAQLGASPKVIGGIKRKILTEAKPVGAVEPYKATMFHGTVKGGGELKPSTMGESGPGIYLSTSKEGATKWADLKANFKPKSGQKVLSYDVELNKPFDAYFNPTYRPNLTNAVADTLGLKTEINKTGNLVLSDYPNPTEALKANGYDGIIRRTGLNEIHEVVAFENKSIKPPEVTKAKGADEYFYVKSGTKSIEVIKNPTHKDYQALSKEVKKDFPDMPKGEPKTRITYDTEGNKYVWRADKGTHPEVEPLINRKYNTTTNQNEYMLIK